jgi:O-acetyl-ADP-ribose deacetylase (regulator of RNase III)
MHIQLLRADAASLKVDAMVTSSQLGESGGGENLLCKFVIQTAVPQPNADDADVELRLVTTCALQRADELAVGSVGLPPLWARPPELLERCARNMLQAAIDFRVRTRSLQRVVFCIFGKPAYETWDRLLRELDR